MSASYRQLLVHLDSTARAGVRLEAARALAQEHEAALAAAYAATPSYMASPFTPGLGGTVLADLLAVDEKHRAIARAAFDAATSRLPVGASSWCEVNDLPLTRAFVQQAFHADLLVLGQNDPQELQARELPPDFVQTVLADSGKPALVIPFAGDLPERMETVVVAWKESREAARAVAAAMPLLRRARHVHVVAGAPDPQCLATGATLGLEKYLRVHGVECQWHRYDSEPAQVGELMLSRAFDLDADLLVMGCYGHSRAREWVMGGATRTILRSMTLPVLMAH